LARANVVNWKTLGAIAGPRIEVVARRPDALQKYEIKSFLHELRARLWILRMGKWNLYLLELRGRSEILIISEMKSMPVRAARQIRDIANKGNGIYTGSSREADQGY